jgi:transposase
MVERGPLWIGHKHRKGAAVEYFAGLDVPLEETAICIVDDNGLIVREARIASAPKALVASFRASGVVIKRVGLEACSLTAWLHLTRVGSRSPCCTGWYRAVHVKDLCCRSWRALLTARRMVLNKRRDLENGIRALLREGGLKVGTPSRRNFAARVVELVADDPELAALRYGRSWSGSIFLRAL